MTFSHAVIVCYVRFKVPDRKHVPATLRKPRRGMSSCRAHAVMILGYLFAFVALGVEFNIVAYITPYIESRGIGSNALGNLMTSSYSFAFMVGRIFSGYLEVAGVPPLWILDGAMLIATLLAVMVSWFSTSILAIWIAAIGWGTFLSPSWPCTLIVLRHTGELSDCMVQVFIFAIYSGQWALDLVMDKIIQTFGTRALPYGLACALATASVIIITITLVFPKSLLAWPPLARKGGEASSPSSSHRRPGAAAGAAGAAGAAALPPSHPRSGLYALVSGQDELASGGVLAHINGNAAAPSTAAKASVQRSATQHQQALKRRSRSFASSSSTTNTLLAPHPSRDYRHYAAVGTNAENINTNTNNTSPNPTNDSTNTTVGSRRANGTGNHPRLAAVVAGAVHPSASASVLQLLPADGDDAKARLGAIARRVRAGRNKGFKFLPSYQGVSWEV
uniref:Uncharacterized protein n=1 Tax=Lotharella oceanica TaxID=641309 RepID=A0A7S2U5L2_9EUKA|mmetsp:Transcript_9076/g.17695  ORF Transcript_9076/g.17695 Transcript_9076/m.17695 type:complete len:448 (+) Transcript_9076:88-1431(+)